MPIINSPSLTLPIGLSVHYRLYWLCANFQCRLRILNHKMETCFLSKKQLKLKKIAYLSLKNLHVTFNLHSPYPCTPQRELHISLCISRRTSQSLLMTWVWRLPCHTIKGPLQTRDFPLSFSFSLSRFRSRVFPYIYAFRSRDVVLDHAWDHVICVLLRVCGVFYIMGRKCVEAK